MNFSEISEEDTKHTESSSAYCEKLKTLRVIMKETRFLEFSARETVLGPGALARVTKELKVLATSLPCEAGGSIFCSFISSNLSLAEALISGPEDTPYEHGLYLFSIQIPSEYPKSPPIVQILTTGNGMIRFNPNLYNNGYVCLSIINTWGGSPQERWNPTFSTLLQVLISIQALVMDCKVVQKEPGFEYYPENSQENKAYSWCVRYGNMTYAVLENLKNPPKAFSEVVQKHFYMKKSQILATLEKWLEEAKNADLDWNSAIVLNHNRQTMALFMEKGLYNVFAALYGQIREQLDSLDSV
jgi:ubiquitin-protein ligase